MRHTSPIKKTICPHDHDATYQLAITLYRLVRSIDATDGCGPLLTRLRNAALGLSECVGRIAGGVTPRHAHRLEDAGAEYCRKVSRMLRHLLDADSLSDELHAKADQLAKRLEKIFLDGVPQAEPSHPNGAASPIEVFTFAWDDAEDPPPVVSTPLFGLAQRRLAQDAVRRSTSGTSFSETS